MRRLKEACGAGHTVFEMEMGERISRHGERRAVVTVAVLKGLKKQKLLIQYCRQYFGHYHEL